MKKYSISGLWLALPFLMMACASPKTKVPDLSYEHREKVDAINSEVSLKSDRDELSSLRNSIPEEIRQENDELKFVLDFFKDIRRDPNQIESQFRRITKRQRDKISKRLTKERENFSKKERKEREAFLAELKKERDEFTKKKHSTEKRKEFYDSQDEKRKEYFANERDRRKDFESLLRQSTSDSNAYFNEKARDFREELIDFKRRKREHEKLKKEGRLHEQENRGSSHSPKRPQNSEFDELDSRPSESLGAE